MDTFYDLLCLDTSLPIAFILHVGNLPDIGSLNKILCITILGMCLVVWPSICRIGYQQRIHHPEPSLPVHRQQSLWALLHTNEGQWTVTWLSISQPRQCGSSKHPQLPPITLSVTGWQINAGWTPQVMPPDTKGLLAGWQMGKSDFTLVMVNLFFKYKVYLQFLSFLNRKVEQNLENQLNMTTKMVDFEGDQ